MHATRGARKVLQVKTQAADNQEKLMPASSPSPESGPVFRVDIFNVPQRARRRFLEAVEATHRVLRTIPGLIEDHILEKPGGPGASSIVTIAMWRDEETVRRARGVVSAWHNST